jgi:hypothetical protein
VNDLPTVTELLTAPAFASCEAVERPEYRWHGSLFLDQPRVGEVVIPNRSREACHTAYGRARTYRHGWYRSPDSLKVTSPIDWANNKAMRNDTVAARTWLGTVPSKSMLHGASTSTSLSIPTSKADDRKEERVPKSVNQWQR